METISVSNLQAKLSEYIAFVKSGGEILVSERGKLVARIVPIDDKSKEDSKRMELSRRGIMKLGKGSISAEVLSDLPVVNISDDVISKVVEEERKSI